MAQEGATLQWMRTRLVCLTLALGALVGVLWITGVAIFAGDAIAQEVDEEVPPGNPVIGSDRPGDVEEVDNTRYGLWALLAICLITAGVLLVKVERWERRRSKRVRS